MHNFTDIVFEPMCTLYLIFKPFLSVTKFKFEAQRLLLPYFFHLLDLFWMIIVCWLRLFFRIFWSLLKKVITFLVFSSFSDPFNCCIFSIFPRLFYGFIWFVRLFCLSLQRTCSLLNFVLHRVQHSFFVCLSVLPKKLTKLIVNIWMPYFFLSKFY